LFLENLLFDNEIASPNFKTIRVKCQSSDNAGFIISESLFYLTPSSLISSLRQLENEPLMEVFNRT